MDESTFDFNSEVGVTILDFNSEVGVTILDLIVEGRQTSSNSSAFKSGIPVTTPLSQFSLPGPSTAGGPFSLPGPSTGGGPLYSRRSCSKGFGKTCSIRVTKANAKFLSNGKVELENRFSLILQKILPTLTM